MAREKAPQVSPEARHEEALVALQLPRVSKVGSEEKDADARHKRHETDLQAQPQGMR